MRLISVCTFSSYTQSLQALNAAVFDAKLEAFEDAIDNSLPGKTLRRLLFEEEEGFEGVVLLLLRSSLHKILEPVQDLWPWNPDTMAGARPYQRSEIRDCVKVAEHTYIDAFSRCSKTLHTTREIGILRQWRAGGSMEIENLKTQLHILQTFCILFSILPPEHHILIS